jgi:hypothetical protein
MDKAIVEHLHWVLLTESRVTVLGAVAGSHGGLFQRSGCCTQSMCLRPEPKTR